MEPEVDVVEITHDGKVYDDSYNYIGLGSILNGITNKFQSVLTLRCVCCVDIALLRCVF